MNKNNFSLKQEQEANEFAMMLLMPEEKFIEVFNLYNRRKGMFEDIANYFGVEIDLARCRALNLGLTVGLEDRY